MRTPTPAPGTDTYTDPEQENSNGGLDTSPAATPGNGEAAWSAPREIFAGGFPASPNLPAAANDQCSRNPDDAKLGSPSIAEITRPTK
ncbi:hypothetical protein VTH82DRAFT_7467 [Thermothelomyces myriococcoides]